MDPTSPSPSHEGETASPTKKKQQAPPSAGDLISAAEGAEEVVKRVVDGEMARAPDGGEMAGSWLAVHAPAASAKPMPVAKAQEAARASGVSWTMVLAILAIIMAALAIERTGRITALAAKATALESALAAKADAIALQEALAQLDGEMRKDRLAIAALESALAAKADAILLANSIGEIERVIAELVGKLAALERKIVELEAAFAAADATLLATLRGELDDLVARVVALESARAALAAPKADPPAPQATTLPASSPADDYYGDEEESPPSATSARPVPADDYYGP